MTTDFEMELSARATVFKEGLMYDYEFNVNDWHLAGDSKILLEALRRSLEYRLNEFANMKSFHVIFRDV